MNKFFFALFFVALLVLDCVKVNSQDFKKLKKEELIEQLVLSNSKFDSLSTKLFESKNSYALLYNEKKEIEVRLSLFQKEMQEFKNSNGNRIASMQLTLDDKLLIISSLEKSLTLLTDSLMTVKMLLVNSRPTEPLRYGGTYTYGKDVELEGVGLLQIHPISKDVLLFCLDVNRGAPSYNMGFKSGQIKMLDNIGYYKDENCDLKFTFGSNYVQVDNDSKEGSDFVCDFGFAVYPDGKYFIDSSEIPTHYYEQDGTKRSFKELLKELN
jgi:hypothetical protein